MMKKENVSFVTLNNSQKRNFVFGQKFLDSFCRSSENNFCRQQMSHDNYDNSGKLYMTWLFQQNISCPADTKL